MVKLIIPYYINFPYIYVFHQSELAAWWKPPQSEHRNRGMAMGPMALGDLVGQELFWKQRKVPFPHWAKVGIHQPGDVRLDKLVVYNLGIYIYI